MNLKLRTRARRSSRGPVAAVAVAAVAAAGFIGVGTAAPAHAAEPSPQCPAPGEFPGLQNYPTFTDNNVNVYVGGDYTATGGAAESEGLLVIAGAAAIDNGKTFNVGRAGVGSGISPTPGSPMLRVGAALTIGEGTTVDVGSGLTGGGASLVGGDVTGEGSLQTNGAESASGIGAEAALGDFANFGSQVASESAALAQQSATGTTTVEGSRVTFTADENTEGMQVFEISAADLSGAGAFYFEVPADVPILVNVTGTGTADVTATYIAFNGTRVDFGEGLGNASSRILWNFSQVSELSLGGSSQFVGSVIAPEADADITASTNGRVYVGGNLRTHGNGNEQHAYPWIGPGSFGCLSDPPTDPTDPTDPRQVSPVEPTVTQAQCTQEGVATDPSVTLPEDSEQISYVVDGEVVAGGTVTVTATAGEGYAFAESVAGWTVSQDGTTATQQITLDEVDCATEPTDPPTDPRQVSPVQPTVTQAQCTQEGVATDPSVTLPEDSEQISYIVDGEVVAGETVTVTATAGEGYTFPETVAGWTVSPDRATATGQITFDEVDCAVAPPDSQATGSADGPTESNVPSSDPQADQLPTTGAGDLATLGLSALGLLALGGVLLARRRRLTA